MSKAAPKRHLWWLLQEAISEMFLWYLLFLCFDCWFKLERLKREPTKCWPHKYSTIPIYIIHFLWERPLVSSPYFLFPTSSSNSNTKQKKVSSLQSLRLLGESPKPPSGGFGQPLLSNLNKKKWITLFLTSLYNNTFNQEKG